MDNHVHLVVQGDIVALSLALRKLNIKYAMHYNFVNKRVGHVFQNRYRSEVVETDSYLAHLVRYVHNNPVKAGLVAEARQYRWSSYGEYLGNLNIVSPIQKQVVLGLFPKGTESFKIFHLEPDENEDLDTAEYIDRDRLKRACLGISQNSFPSRLAKGSVLVEIDIKSRYYVYNIENVDQEGL